MDASADTMVVSPEEASSEVQADVATVDAITTEAVSEEEKPEPVAVEEPEPMDHRQFLMLYCRLCGQRNVAHNSLLRPLSFYSKVLRILHEVDVEEESADIFPTSVCDACHDVYQVGGPLQLQVAKLAKQRDALTELSRAHPLADFWAHSSHLCVICTDASWGEVDWAVEARTQLTQVETLPEAEASPPPDAAGNKRGGGGGGGGGGPAKKRKQEAPAGPPRQVKMDMSELFGGNRRYRASLLTHLLLSLRKTDLSLFRALRTKIGLQLTPKADEQIMNAYMTKDMGKMDNILKDLTSEEKLFTLSDTLENEKPANEGGTNFLTQAGVNLGVFSDVPLDDEDDDGSKPDPKDPEYVPGEDESEIASKPLATDKKKPVRSRPKKKPADRGAVKSGLKKVSPDELRREMMKKSVIVIRKSIGGNSSTGEPPKISIRSVADPSEMLNSGKAIIVRKVIHRPKMAGSSHVAATVRMRNSLIGAPKRPTRGLPVVQLPKLNETIFKKYGVEPPRASTTMLKKKMALSDVLAAATASVAKPCPAGKKKRRPWNKKLTPEELAAAKEAFQRSLPASRAMRGDVLRYILQKADEAQLTLLKKVGIHYGSSASEDGTAGRTGPASTGSYICKPALTNYLLETCKSHLGPLTDIQWAVVMAESIFKLMHPQDSLTLQILGIKVDAKHAKVPLFYRIGQEIKRIMVEEPADTNLCEKLVKTFYLRPVPPHIRAVDAVLGCGPEKAEEFIRKGGGGAAEEYMKTLSSAVSAAAKGQVPETAPPPKLVEKPQPQPVTATLPQPVQQVQQSVRAVAAPVRGPTATSNGIVNVVNVGAAASPFPAAAPAVSPVVTLNQPASSATTIVTLGGNFQQQQHHAPQPLHPQQLQHVVQQQHHLQQHHVVPVTTSAAHAAASAYVTTADEEVVMTSAGVGVPVSTHTAFTIPEAFGTDAQAVINVANAGAQFINTADGMEIKFETV